MKDDQDNDSQLHDQDPLGEFTEEDFRFDPEEEDELNPVSERKWLKRMIAGLVAIVLLGNLIAFFPMVFNLQAIQFLKKTRELSQNEQIQQYKKAIVVIKAEDRKGTGFNIDSRGLIITNQHVIGDVKYASIKFEDGGIYLAEVMISDPNIDIALLKVVHSDTDSHPTTSVGFPIISIETEQQWEKGMHFFVIGNPLFFNRIANEGTIMGLTSLEDWDLPVMAIRAPIYKGNSGSPIINSNGKVIAVVFATTKIQQQDGTIKVGLAIPIEYLSKYLEDAIVNL